jgi:hypothetical protein
MYEVKSLFIVVRYYKTMVIFDEIGKIEEKAVVMYLPRGTKGNHENLRTVGVPAQIGIGCPNRYKPEVLRLESPCAVIVIWQKECE